MMGGFFAGPNGVGEQCYREYETLISGTCVVLDDTTYTARKGILSGLPVIMVSNWSDVTPAFLEAKYEEMNRRSYDVTILYAPYWYDAILKALGVA